MELAKHSNHRNSKYLAWLRKRPCAVSNNQAQCAHHIRLGTNGGSGLKPSDYFCIPLLNYYHTSGPEALHIIGEGSFFNKFKLNRNSLFITYLKTYLEEEYEIIVHVAGIKEEDSLALLIKLIEERRPKLKEKTLKKSKAKKENTLTPKVSLIDNDFYQKAKESKRAKDKELRQQLKENKKASSSPKLKGTEFYEKAKVAKKLQDKELRQQLKSIQKPTISNNTNSEYYEKAKQARKAQEKELRTQNKERMSKYRKEQYQKLKELRQS